jgi:uncharacterized protein
MMAALNRPAIGATMDESQPATFQGVAPGSPADRERQARQWALFLHLSALAGYVVFGAGFAAPILIWQLKKADYPELDQHGKNVLNWLISYVIYMAISGVLVTVFVGIPLLLILGVLMVIFPIIGGIKANNGEAWKYPLTIPFVH